MLRPLVIAVAILASSLSSDADIRKVRGRKPRHRTLGVGGNRFPGKGKGSSSKDNIFKHSEDSITTAGDFLLACRSSLLSFSTTTDGLISQMDIADFISDMCSAFGDGAVPAFGCPSPLFSDLSKEVQLSFVWYICPRQDYAGLQSCLEEFMDEQEFGYAITGDSSDVLPEKVSGFCCSLLPFVEAVLVSPLSTSLCPSNLPVVDPPIPATTPRPTPIPPAPTPRPIATIAPLPNPTMAPVIDVATPQPSIIIPTLDPSLTLIPGQPTPSSGPVVTIQPAGSIPTTDPSTPSLPGQPTITNGPAIPSQLLPSFAPNLDGTASPTDGQPVNSLNRGEISAADDDDGLSTGATIGIALGSVALLAAGLAAVRRRRTSDDF